MFGVLDDVIISDDETLMRVVDNAGAGATYLARLVLLAPASGGTWPVISTLTTGASFLRRGATLSVAWRSAAVSRNAPRQDNRNAQCACHKQ